MGPGLSSGGPLPCKQTADREGEMQFPKLYLPNPTCPALSSLEGWGSSARPCPREKKKFYSALFHGLCLPFKH